MDNDFSRAMKNFDRIWARVQQSKTGDAKSGSDPKGSAPCSGKSPGDKKPGYGGRTPHSRPCSGRRGPGRR